MIKMSVFNKINDNLIVDTFKNVLQRRSSEVFQAYIPEFRTIQKYMLDIMWKLVAFPPLLLYQLKLMPSSHVLEEGKSSVLLL